MLYVYMNIFRFELHMYMYYQMCTYIKNIYTLLLLISLL